MAEERTFQRQILLKGEVRTNSKYYSLSLSAMSDGFPVEGSVHDQA